MSGSLIDLFVVLEVPEDLDLELKERCGLDTGCGPGISLYSLEFQWTLLFLFQVSALGEHDAGLAGPHLQPSSAVNAFTNLT